MNFKIFIVTDIWRQQQIKTKRKVAIEISDTMVTRSSKKSDRLQVPAASASSSTGCDVATFMTLKTNPTGMYS
jgi:hypothetical protein